MNQARQTYGNYFKEKHILKEEEKSLREMLAKFHDQLNRLKIEELALQSHIKLQSKEQQIRNGGPGSASGFTVQASDTRSIVSSTVISSNTSTVPVSVMEDSAALEKVINDEELDLAVDANSFIDQFSAYNQDQEVEEEEEDEDASNQLLAYMGDD